MRFALALAGLAGVAGCASDIVSADARSGTNSVPDSAATTTPGCMPTATGGVVCASGASTSKWQLVSVGGDHTCALRTNGAAYCWGSNRNGQLGATTVAATCGSPAFSCSTVPVAAMPSLRFVSMSAGANHTCALTQTGDPLCWGSDEFGQVGPASSIGSLGMRQPGGPAWIQISAGLSHTCAVRGDGAVFCWGANDKGELGNGSTSSTSGPVRAALPGPASSVSAGEARTCARTTTNVVYCWGAVWTERQDGWEMTRVQTTPELVPNAPALGTVSVGGFTTCGSDAGGVAYCWEGNPRGEIGDGTETGSQTPTRVATTLDLRHVSSGLVQSCGVTVTGDAYCWGDDTFGELGVAPTLMIDSCDQQGVACSTVPVEVSGGHAFAQVSTGLGSHTCGVTLDGDVLCWGLGISGQRGDGTATYIVSSPTAVVATSP